MFEEPLVAIWGYDDLVNDPEHLSLLISDEPNAVAEFNRRYARAELDVPSLPEPE